MRSALVVAFAVIFGISGCGASVQGNVSAGTKGENEVADFDKPMDAPTTASTAVQQAPSDVALLGARQDLSYAGPATVLCKCLAVAVGQPNDRAFHWAGKAPKTNVDNQLVVALSSAGVACPDASGASYWGYESVGNDVVVVVEQASPGRPIASGAIIPRPLATGQVYVRPVDKKLPYGHPATGLGDRCQIGTLAPPSGASLPSTASPSSPPEDKTDPFGTKRLSTGQP